MGHVNANSTLIGPRGRQRLRGVVVDTGASYTVIEPATMKALGLSPAPGRMSLELGNGRVVRARGSTARVRIERREGFTTVLSFRGAQPVVGVETLELLGLDLDLRRHLLVAKRRTALALYYGTAPRRRRRRNQR